MVSKELEYQVILKQVDPTMLPGTGKGWVPGQGPNVGRTVFAQPGTEAYKSAMDQAGFFDKALMTAKEYTGSLSLQPDGTFTTGRFGQPIGGRMPESFKRCNCICFTIQQKPQQKNNRFRRTRDRLV